MRFDSAPSPELALLLACAGEPDSTDLRPLAGKTADWDKVLLQAELHGLRPLLCRSLQSRPEAVPASVLEQLMLDSQANARRSLLLSGELVRVLTLLGERGVRAIPYKGPLLASLLYGNLSLREFVDLDILVSPAQVRAGADVLLAAGYQLALPLSPRQQAALFRSNCEFLFTHSERQSTVELHWRIAPAHLAVEFDFDRFWERRQPVSLGGREASTLADEDLLLVLSVHAAKHLWERLCWTCDISGLLRSRPHLDWAPVLSQARALGVSRLLLVSLHLSREILGASLPAIVSEAIAADPKVGTVARAVQARMWTAAGRAMSLRDHWLLLRTRERWPDRARYAGRLAFTPGVSEWELLELPALLWPLYPAIRLGRVAGKLLHDLGRHSPFASSAATPLNQSPPSPRA